MRRIFSHLKIQSHAPNWASCLMADNSQALSYCLFYIFWLRDLRVK